MPKIFRTENGDKCDSGFEVMVVDDLIARGVPYDHHPGVLSYHKACIGGYCLDCDSNNVRKGCTYEPDLYLPEQNMYIELKGGDMKVAARGRLIAFARTGDVPIRFLFRDNRRIRGTQSNHLQWAAKLKCVAAVGKTIPESWLQEYIEDGQ